MIKRRVYTKEFKIEAVELTERSEKTVRDISDELGISYQLLCKWRNKYLKEGMDSFRSVNANIKLIIIANIKVNSFDKEKYTILSIKYEENCNESRVRRGIKYFEVFKNEA